MGVKENGMREAMKVDNEVSVKAPFEIGSIGASEVEIGVARISAVRPDPRTHQIPSLTIRPPLSAPSELPQTAPIGNPSSHPASGHAHIPSAPYSTSLAPNNPPGWAFLPLPLDSSGNIIGGKKSDSLDARTAQAQAKIQADITEGKQNNVSSAGPSLFALAPSLQGSPPKLASTTPASGETSKIRERHSRIPATIVLNSANSRRTVAEPMMADMKIIEDLSAVAYPRNIMPPDPSLNIRVGPGKSR